jgi:hypothetical protein
MMNRLLTRVLVHSSSSVIDAINQWGGYGEHTGGTRRHSC